MARKQTTYLKFERNAYRKMMTYARLAEGEISGFGLVDEIDGSLYVADIILPDQEAGPGHVDLDQRDITRIITERVMAGDLKFPERLKLWWHSHSDFGCFKSGTDDATVDRLLEYAPYVVCLVVNNKEEYEASLHVAKPVPVHTDDVKIIIVDSDEDEMTKRCREDIERLVHTPPPPKFERPFDPITTFNKFEPAQYLGFTKGEIDKADETKQSRSGYVWADGKCVPIEEWEKSIDKKERRNKFDA